MTFATVTRPFAVIARPFTARVRISGAAVILLAASAVIGNVGQYVDRGRAQEQIAALQSDRDADIAQTECARRIAAYTDGVSLTLQGGSSAGLLLGLVDENADLGITLDEAIAISSDATAEILRAAVIRAAAPEICADNPDFDPATDDAPAVSR